MLFQVAEGPQLETVTDLRTLTFSQSPTACTSEPSSCLLSMCTLPNHIELLLQAGLMMWCMLVWHLWCYTHYFVV